MNKITKIAIFAPAFAIGMIGAGCNNMHNMGDKTLSPATADHVMRCMQECTKSYTDKTQREACVKGCDMLHAHPGAGVHGTEHKRLNTQNKVMEVKRAREAKSGTST